MESVIEAKRTQVLEEVAKPAIPLKVALWDCKSIATYLGLSYRQVMDRTTKLAGFPAPIRLPAEKSWGQPRWKATEVIRWAESFQEK